MFKNFFIELKKKISKIFSFDKRASTSMFQLTIINHVNIKDKVRKKQQ